MWTMEIWYKTHCPTCRATNWTETDNSPCDICKCWGCGSNYPIDVEYSKGLRLARGDYGDGTPYETLDEYLAVTTDAVEGKKAPD